ncbi:nitrite reductase small subunit NirD [Paroceanicella profunda]|uniref:Nitrite reductase small subunit NirD n=1 Tax=Paroceanicella profunda TaxID=2579971 RepID=A0A5B8FGV3_9RHOB|nr:nitrite reductase small subunit NirD [Paroceanicella profunda]QDL91427.1 nitrite reductase small subunit NirD [Paroceanicella profunda]
MSDFIDIGALEDIPLQGARVVRTHMGCIAVFRTAEDEVFALDDACPHKKGPLSNGIQHGRAVTCPLHNWVIDLSTGRATGADEGGVATYPVTVAEGRILLDAASLAARLAAQ